MKIMQPTSKHKVSLTHKYKGISLNGAQNQRSNHRRGSICSAWCNRDQNTFASSLCTFPCTLRRTTSSADVQTRPSVNIRQRPTVTHQEPSVKNQPVWLGLTQTGLLSMYLALNRIHDTVCGLCLDLLADCMILRVAAMLVVGFFQRGHSDSQWRDILHFG